jgi:hypothetical protein
MPFESINRIVATDENETFVARHAVIFTVVTKSRRYELHLMQAKKGNVDAACRNPRAQLQDIKHNCNGGRLPPLARVPNSNHMT